MFDNISHYEKSEIGFLRPDNEDSYLIVDQYCNNYDLERSGMMFVIADGLGGHAAGEIASKMACEETVSTYYNGAIVQNNGDAAAYKMRKLEKSLWSVHDKIINFAREREEMRGMGTTLSALVLTGNAAFIAHVGDSRIYRCRNGSCERMTVDHTKTQDLIDSGQIHPGHENNHYYHHIITQALGGYDDLTEVYTRREDVRKGDVFLLCTDGLHDLVTDQEIQEILMGHSLPQITCEALVQAALRNGGHDNVTVIVVQV